MLKWLLVIAVVVGIYFFFIKKKPIQGHRASEDVKESDEMVACISCQTFCSVNEAFIKEGKYYCSKECMEA
jgi:uncharacterized protein